MTSKSKIIARLDGYLDALSLVNGEFRSSWYFAYMVKSKMAIRDENLQLLYKSRLSVEFGKMQSRNSWVGWIQDELESCLLKNPFGKKFDKVIDGKRAFQAAWYVVEMIRIITDDFKCEEMYKCEICVKSDDGSSQGYLYVFPIDSGYLIINLQWSVDV